VTWIQSGNWQPGTHRIKILTGPIFSLERGRVCGVREWVRLEMSSADLMRRVAGVGNDFTMDPAIHWCVKKNQAIPMGMGGPSILIGGKQ
jgi:predicted Zn-dependent protease